MTATLPPVTQHRRPGLDARRWLTLPVAAGLTAAVALVVIAGVIPPVRDIRQPAVRDAAPAVSALWAGALANLFAASLFIVTADGPRLETAAARLRLAALGDAAAATLVLSATLLPFRRLPGWVRAHARTPLAVALAVLLTFAFLVLLAAGRGVLAFALTLALALAAALFTWRRFHPDAPRPGLPGLPSSPLGRWALWLLSGFALCFAVFLWAVALGARGGETFFSNPFLALTILAAGALALAAGLVAAVAVISQRERSLLAFVALILGLLALLFTLGEVLAPH